MQVNNTADLRKMLLDTINGVRSGSVDHKQAAAISNLSSRILQSAKLDLDVAKMKMVDSSASPSSLSLIAQDKTEEKAAA